MAGSARIELAYEVSKTSILSVESRSHRLAQLTGFEPAWNGLEVRRIILSATAALKSDGPRHGIRTHTARILSPVPLPVGVHEVKADGGDSRLCPCVGSCDPSTD